MVSGATARTKALSTVGGRTVTVAAVRPEGTLENIRQLRAASDRWHEDAALISDPRAQRRAFFASSVAFKGGMRLADGSCCVLVAQEEPAGEILGVAVYRSDGGSWWLDDMALAPRRQANELNADPVRGIGTVMLGVIADDVATGACSRLQLKTLDAQAEEFWRGRGFHNTTEPLHMACPEVRDLARELASSHPDRPDEGDVPFAGDHERWREVEVPGTLARL